MGRYGQAILTIAGTIIGTYFGYPALGAALGGLAGQLLYPTKLPTINGPRLSDLSQTQASVGGPIPRGWGTFPSAGCIIAKSDYREVIQSDEVGGKGGPSQTTKTASYFQDFAIGLNDGLIGGVRSIWANGKPIYDRRPRRTEETDAQFTARMAASDLLDLSMVVYLGTEDQLPDPTLETFYGVGNISAFRGLAYLVFTNWQAKPEDGNRVPTSWKVECYETGTASGGSGIEYSNDVLFPWRPIGGDPRNPLNEHAYVGANLLPGASLHSTLAEAVEDVAAYYHRTQIDPVPIAWSVERGDFLNPFMGDGLAHEYVNLQLLVNRTLPADQQGPMIGEGGAGNGWRDVCSTVYIAGYDFGHQWWWVGANLGVPTTQGIDNHGIYTFHEQCGFPVTIQIPPFDPESVLTANGCSQFGGCDGNQPAITLLPDLTIQVGRIPRAPINPCNTEGAIEIPELPGYCIVNGELVRSSNWTLDSQTYNVLQQYATGSVDGAPSQVTAYPLNPARPQGHADDNQSFWEAAYNAAVLNGEMHAGKVYGVDYPVAQNHGYTRFNVSGATVETDSAQVSTIVRDLCKEAGFVDADINTDDIDELVIRGAVRTRVMAPRAMLDPLRQALRFDGFESNRQVKWIRRGGAVAHTFDADELGYAVAGEAQPSRVTTQKAQDVDLPRSVRVHYLSPARDYEPGEQDSPQRLETEAVNDLDVELPIVMVDDDAAQTAQILWSDAWAGRWSHDIVIDGGAQQFEPTDIVVLPVDSRAERCRIIEITDQFPACRKMVLARDDVASWTSYAIASVPPYVPPPLLFAGPVEVLLLDLPALRDQDDEAGFYAAIRPYLAGSVAGGTLFRSVDNGGTFDQVANFNGQSTIGVLLAPLPGAIPYVFDTTSELVIKLQNGTLESRARADVLAGANAAAIGIHGRWEIIQFLDIEPLGTNSYRLTGLLRGRRGTEHTIGTSQTGDRFVLLSGPAIVRVPLDAARIGQTLKYRAIGPAGNLSSALTIEFAGHAEALKPFSPVQVRGERDPFDNLTLTWIRRSRLGQTLQSGHDIPLNEATEAYRIDIQDPLEPDRTIGTLTSATTTVSYSIGQQIADGIGPADDVILTVRQISAIVGAGYPASLTLAPSVSLPIPGTNRSTDLNYLEYAKGSYPGGGAIPKLAYRVKFTGYVVDVREFGGSYARTLTVLPDGSPTSSGAAGAFDVIDVARDPADARYFFIAQLYLGQGFGVGPGQIRRIDSQAFIPSGILSGVTTATATVGFTGDPEGIVVIGSYVYAACPYEGVVRKYQAIDLTPAGVLNVAIPVWSLMTDGTDLWGLQRVNGAPGIMANIDQTDGSTISSFPVGIMPADGKIVGGFLYCVCAGPAELQKYDLATGVQQGFTLDMSGDSFSALRNYLTLDGTLLSVGRSDIHVIDTTTDTVDP